MSGNPSLTRNHEYLLLIFNQFLPDLAVALSRMCFPNDTYTFQFTCKPSVTLNCSSPVCAPVLAMPTNHAQAIICVHKALPSSECSHNWGVLK